MAHRYDYAVYKTREAAERSLEDSYSTGDILPGEAPCIERRSHKTASWSKERPTFVITLMDWSAY
jgi:hypothetical protein